MNLVAPSPSPAGLTGTVATVSATARFRTATICIFMNDENEIKRRER